jgi:hypothetical protein
MLKYIQILKDKYKQYNNELGGIRFNLQIHDYKV